jgi:CheY-like chemotaxis protein
MDLLVSPSYTIAWSVATFPSMSDQGSQILVVDDDDTIRESFASVLRDEGFSVAAARNGLEALSYLESHTPPRVIVLDLMMPVMSGAEFRQKQLAEPRFAGIPVIVMSATERGGSIAKALHAAGFLSKPPHLELLIETVAPYC